MECHDARYECMPRHRQVAHDVEPVTQGAAGQGQAVRIVQSTTSSMSSMSRWHAMVHVMSVCHEQVDHDVKPAGQGGGTGVGGGSEPGASSLGRWHGMRSHTARPKGVQRLVAECDQQVAHVGSGRFS